MLALREIQLAIRQIMHAISADQTAICRRHSSVWTGIGRRTRPISAFVCWIRSRIWANAGNSSRNATRLDFVCVDRSGPWEFVPFVATFKFWTEWTQSTGRTFEKYSMRNQKGFLRDINAAGDKNDAALILSEGLGDGCTTAEQIGLKCRNLRIDHVIEGHVTAMRKSEVLCTVR